MKTKRNKLVNHLKLGILFFGMILAFNNCQKEENYIIETSSPINLEKAKKMFATQFNKEIFPNLNHNPIWEEAKADYDREGNFYYEIPFHLLSKKDIDISSSVSFDRLIIQEKEGQLKFEIIHFFNIDIKNNPVNYQSLSHKNLLNFSGFITKYDIDKNILNINYYKSGKDTYQKVKISDKKKSDLLSKANENSEEFSETWCTRWCVTYRGDDGSIEYGNCTDWDCHTSYYYLSDGSDSDSNGGNGSGSNTSYNSTNKECEKGYTLNYDGKCVAIPFQIDNQLKGKDKCAYEELKKLELFKNTIKKFGNGSNYNLTLKSWTNGACNSSYDDGCTDASDLSNGNITIYIQAPGRGTLDTAALILHEGIHAEIYKYVDEHKKGIDPNNRKELLDYYFQYKANNDNTLATSNAQHQYMADKFVKPIAQALRQLDNDKYSLNDYLGLAWEGLRRYGWDGYSDNGNWVTLDRNQYTGNMNKVLDNTDFNKNCE